MRHPQADAPASAHRPGRTVAGLLVGMVAGLGGLGLAGPAAAHDALVSSDPAPDAVLAEAPERVVLTFAAAQAGVGSEVLVTDAAGEIWSDGAAQVDDTTVTQPLRPGLPNGVYTVTWRSVAGDGHPVTGTFAFTVDAPALVATAEPTGEPTGEPTRKQDDPTATAEPAATSPADASAVTAPDGGAEPPAWAWPAAAAVVALVVVGAVALRRRGSHD